MCKSQVVSLGSIEYLISLGVYPILLGVPYLDSLGVSYDAKDVKDDAVPVGRISETEFAKVLDSQVKAGWLPRLIATYCPNGEEFTTKVQEMLAVVGR